MNKMAKGALAIGVGAALLLGGGGTLAVWNAEVNASAGEIATGDLKMSAAEGAWASTLTGGKIDVARYAMVPGEKLTYSQTLNIKLDGDRITANLAATGAVADKAFASEADVKIEYNTTASDENKWVSAASGATAIPLQLGKGEHTVRARITVDFKNLPVNVQGSTMQKLPLTGVGFKLEQNEPTTAPSQAPVVAP